MPAESSWSLRGVDPKVRQAARDAARREGVTVGQWINRKLLEEGGSLDEILEEEERASRRRGRDRDSEDDVDETRGSVRSTRAAGNEDISALTRAIEQLTRRIDATEQRTTLAITGIDQSVSGIISRLKSSEEGQNQISSQFDEALDEVDAVRNELASRLHRLESDDSAQKNLEALKSLEAALGDIAAQNETSGQELSARFQDLEKSVSGIVERFQQSHADLAQTTADLARRIDTSNEHASLQLRRTREELEKALENKAAKLEEQARSSAERAEAADERFEKLASDITERLENAERATNNAIRALEGSFASLDQRLDAAEEARQETPDGLTETLQALKAETEQATQAAKLEALAASKAASDTVRDAEASLDAKLNERLAQVESRIAAVAAKAQSSGNVEDVALAAREAAIGALERVLANHLQDVESRIRKAEQRQADAIRAISDRFSDDAGGVPARLAELEERIERTAEQAVDSTADIDRVLEARFAEVDQRTSASIARMGEEVTRAVERLQEKFADNEERQRTTLTSMREQVEALTGRVAAVEEAGRDARDEEEDEERRQLARALSAINRRLDENQEVMTSSLSPLKKAIQSLSSRVEVMEDRSVQGFAGAQEPPPPPFAPRDTAERGGQAERIDPFAQAADVSGRETPSETDALEENAPGAAADRVTVDEDDAEGDDYFQKLLDDGVETLGRRESDDEVDVLEADPLDRTDIDLDGQPSAGEDALELRDREVADDTLPEPDPEPWSSDNVVRNLRRQNRGAKSEVEADEPGFGVVQSGGKKGLDRRVVYGLAGLAIASVGVAFVMMRGNDAETSGGGNATDPMLSDLINGRTGNEASAPIIDAGPVAPPAVSEAVTDPLAGDVDENAWVGAEGEEALDALLAEEAGSFADEVEPSAPSGDAGSVAQEPAPSDTAPVQSTPAPTGDAEAPVPAAETPAPAEPAPNIVVPNSIRLAAEGGNPIAQYQLGTNLIDAGELERGVAYVQQAAASGLAPAQYRLAKLHESGQGVPPSMTDARRWTERAAEAGNRKAMHYLGILYAEGRGTSQNFDQAAKWFQDAAALGSTDSQFNLAILYEQGLGVPQSMPDAYAWYSIAARSGDRDALQKSREIGNNLAPEAKEEADAAVRSFRPAPVRGDVNGLFADVGWEMPVLQGPAAVQRAQSLLNQLGYDAGPADGLMGSRTRSALITYQRSNGLEQTGRVDAALLRRLEADTGR